MDQVTATIIVGLSTIVGSGVVSSIVTYKLGKSKEHQMFMRQKSEALYLSACEFESNFNGDMIGHFQLLKGKINYDAMLGMQISDGSKERPNGGAQTMTMLAEIYFPSARASLKDVWKARDAYAAITTEIKHYWLKHGHADDPELKQIHLAATKALGKSITDFKREIIKAGRRHAGEAITMDSE